MLKCYFELLEHLDMNDDTLVEYLPPPAANRRLRALLKELKKVESVAKALEGAEVTLLDVRVWFDGLLTIKPQYERYIGPRAQIIHSPGFEAACVRVLGGDAGRLKRAERAALEPFRHRQAEAAGEAREDGEGPSSSEEDSFVVQLQKRRRIARKEVKYDLLASIQPTSNIAERYFSVARTTLGQERHSLQPITLEIIMFLRQNAGYWNAQTVDNATQ
ncbi:hypothetical protein F442_21006 [Phytophthora nicotianae P10297]|uniref:HAT C-terminal dimerisation domain-containing protein n=1 Tax=Phytophthora nicotianae P10297 TaxID=1317064 RepID=W2Y464_PHYNI|nr:hypothetical protein F442_21006 [Phytophthora nicotianae P10297]